MFHFGTLDPPSPVLLPFLLDKKVPKNQGRHQGPAAQGGRPSPMSARPPRPARTSFGKPDLGTLQHQNQQQKSPHLKGAELNLIRGVDFQITNRSYKGACYPAFPVRRFSACKITTFPRTRKGKRKFLFVPAGSAEHVIPAEACAVAWDLCFVEPSVFLSFPLDKKGPKNQGRHHRTSPQSGRFPARRPIPRAQPR